MCCYLRQTLGTFSLSVPLNNGFVLEAPQQCLFMPIRLSNCSPVEFDVISSSIKVCVVCLCTNVLMFLTWLQKNDDISTSFPPLPEGRPVILAFFNLNENNSPLSVSGNSLFQCDKLFVAIEHIVKYSQMKIDRRSERTQSKDSCYKYTTR